jgi:predicted DNA-binding transcriptional regulator AlpA
MNDQLLNINDLAQRLKIPAKTIRNKLSQGTWPIAPLRIGRALRWRESDIDAMISAETARPVSSPA